MAKKTTEPGIIEQHVEKAVLGVALILALLALGFWVTSSPRTVTLKGPGGSDSTFPPPEADPNLSRMAEQVRKHVENVKPPIVQPPDYKSHLIERIQAPYDGSKVQPIVMLTPDRPAMKLDFEAPKRAKIELAKLQAAIVKPDMPKLEMNREVQIIPPPENAAPPAAGAASAVPQNQEKEVIAAHAVALYDFGKVMKQWEDLTKAGLVRPRFIVMAVEVERRQKSGKGDWQTTPSFKAYQLADPLPVPVIPNFAGENADEVNQAVDNLAVAEIQAQIIEPQYPMIMWPNGLDNTWQIHKPRTVVSDLVDESGSPTPMDNRVPMIAPRGGDMMRMLPRPGGREFLDVPQGSIPPPRTQLPSPRQGSGGSPSGTGGGRDMSRMDAPPSSIRPSVPVPKVAPAPTPRPTVTPKPAVEPDKPVDLLPQPVLVPPVSVQIANPKGLLEIWFHDDTLAQGASYSYRVRLVLVNPLLAQPRDTSKDEEAKVIALSSPWSDWSEPVVVGSPVEFFVTGETPAKGEAYLTIFTQKYGATIKCPSRMAARMGEPMGGVVEVDVRRTNGSWERTKVDFRCGTCVDIDFNKKVKTKGTHSMVSSVEVIYEDADGELKSRVAANDLLSDRYKNLEKFAQPPKPAGGSGTVAAASP